MKIQLYILIFFSSVLFLSCENNSKYEDFELHSLKATLQLPISYKVVNDKGISAVINKVEDSQFRSQLLSLLKQNPEDILLVDTLNPYYYILISDITPSIEIDSNSFYYIIDKERLKSCTEPKIDSTYYVGSKMGESNGIKFIESKYLRYDNKKRQRIGHVFLLTSEQTTTAISFFSPEEQNATKYIETIKK